MKVLLLGDLEQPHTQRWASALDASGLEVLTVGFGVPSGIAGDAATLGADVGRDLTFLGAIPRVAAIARRFRPDVVHAHFATNYGVLGHVAAPGRPQLVSAWGSDILTLHQRTRSLRRATRRVLRHAAAVTYDSVDIGDLLGELAPSTPRSLVVFGPDATWLDVRRADEQRIASPRQLKRLYRITDIIDAFAHAGGVLDGWSLDVLTSGADGSPLRRHAQNLKVDDRIDFHPRLNPDELRIFFGRCPVFVSVPETDGTSVSLLEGMAAGSLPVVSDLRANRMWVEDGVNGLVVPVGDTRSLADALSRAAVDKDLRRRAQHLNRELVVCGHTWNDAVERMLQLYRSVHR